MSKAYGRDRPLQCRSLRRMLMFSGRAPTRCRPHDRRRAVIGGGAHCGATQPSPSRSGAGARAGAGQRRVAQQHFARRLRGLGELRRLPRRDPRHVARVADAADDAAGAGRQYARRSRGGPAATFRFKDDTARLVRTGRRAVRRADVGQSGDQRYRVTRVIGGRYREDFAGVEEGVAGAREVLLPVSYVFETDSLRLKGYSVLVSERPGLRAGGVWSQTCIFCHNTVPYFDAMWGELAGPRRARVPGGGRRQVVAARAALAADRERGRRGRAARRGRGGGHRGRRHARASGRRPARRARCAA